MKIFGKKKSRNKAKKETEKPRAVFQSDPVVEELLKTDKSEWNAKQRRMVERYLKRKATEQTSEQATGHVADANEEKGEEQDAAVNEAMDGDAAVDIEKLSADDGDDNVAAAKSGDGNDDVADDDSSEDGADAKKDATGDKEMEKDAATTVQNPESPSTSEQQPASATKDDATTTTTTSTITTTAEKADATKTDNDESGKIPADHEVWEIVEKLPSKPRRTLKRKLERKGAEVLDEVLAEAKQKLGLDEGVNIPKKISTSKTKKGKKRKADWSALSPEERLRREEQRRLQKEAAERLSQQGTTASKGYKHPLNSERRRANRRKPKYKKRGSDQSEQNFSEYKKDHHTSGFLHRKNNRQDDQ
eukprot:CAMPEP_0119561480 /NCGR_PEP_ID=MMETSP1352-20130426/17761_1 /TAXON_ID=265584 /ORGANISM="Stauroneis constricta, Strain CCMP1120" /LENGTH=360 /DNA_ID=CAMNT_0007609695 /DNA_START=57 /DNA_END=1139 /DNA_ORIENTATION=+